ncbi:hypothetical protein U5801_21590 [Lamprobacter modestohalophilus]|uniref:hypothetical protein n=1 Tax=Lamprobacter modestohalophilus TaxID=1064514 RepID=UPI002ADEBFA5|nr:hypothetical protein [Lamprobacter modestohalophilus]MEA1052378.1 hypothetical protein [Lamprobacter modestohalophilus]
MTIVQTPRNAPQAPPAPQASAPPFNVLIQARVPNGDDAPQFELKRINGVLDAIDKLKPLLKVELEGPDGQRMQHQLAYQADPDGGFKDWVEAQTSIAHTIEHLLPSPTTESEGGAAHLDGVGYLMQDLWRKAACDRFLEYYRSDDDAKAALTDWLNRSASGQQADFPELVSDLPAFAVPLGTVERQSVLPAPASCDPTAITELQAKLAKSRDTNGQRHKTTLEYAERLRLWPFADAIASQTLMGAVQNHLASASGTPDADGLLTEIETAGEAINARFERNLKTALAARDRVLSSIYQLHSLFHRLPRNLIGKVAPIQVWLANAHWFPQQGIDESVIGAGDYLLGRSKTDDPIHGNPAFWGQPSNCGLTLKAFEAISDTSMAPTMFVITDRLQGGREEASLALVAQTRRVSVIANIDNDVFAGKTLGSETNVKEAVGALGESFGGSGEEGADGVGIFGVDLAVRGGTRHESLLTVPPAAEAAGLLLAADCEEVPTGADFAIPWCLGIPEGAINLEDLADACPVNMVRQIEGPTFYFRTYQGLDATRANLIHRLIQDRVTLVCRRFLMRHPPPADSRTLEEARRGLNADLKASFRMHDNSLLVSAAIPRDHGGAIGFSTNDQGITAVEVNVSVQLKNWPDLVRVSQKLLYSNGQPIGPSS